MSNEKTRSRLAEILGVEEDEVWMVKDRNALVYRIHDGVREYQGANSISPKWHICESEGSLSDLIAHPERIIRKPQFTEDEMGMLRCLRAGGVVEINRYGSGSLCVIGEEIDDENGTGKARPSWYMPAFILTSIKPGQSIILADILEG